MSLDNSSYDHVYKKILFCLSYKYLAEIELLLLFASNYPINITSTRCLLIIGPGDEQGCLQKLRHIWNWPPFVIVIIEG